MVNTRRTESVGSTTDISLQHRTRRSVQADEGEDNNSSTVSESEESNEEESWGGPRKSNTRQASEKNGRVRELRSRFIYNDRKYTSRCLRSTELESRKHISLNERRSLAMYTRNHHDDSDFSEDEIYTNRSSRARCVSQSRSHMARIQRRTELSLRPISQKSYADSHSSHNFNSDSEEVGVRRSQRKRKVKFENISWLADDQMHKVGYPNLHTTEYSEEDSREAQDMVSIETNTRTTRYSNTSNKRRETKNPKYLYDYETNKISSKRRKNTVTLIERNKNDERHTRMEANDKENKQELNVNGRTQTRSRNSGNENDKKMDKNVVNGNDEKDDKNDVVENGTIKEEPDKNEDESNKPATSESDEIPKMRTRKPPNRIIPDEKESESSSSESDDNVRRSYMLRNRVPKPAPKSMKSSALRSHELTRSRRRFTRRHKEPPSTSDSSSDTEKSRAKPPKSPHSKNDQRIKSGVGGSKIIPIGPEKLDTKVRFNSIGGLDGHIQCLKEMILLPMMYPEVFKQFQIEPPRGVLFHGPPGTGKTLIARALASECSLSCRKVSFFMRKGADLLSKWIGESEKQLRLLFEQASEMKPSIIFFDELDGLAPVRSSRQDQVHASIVSTLLALMDGLDNRGEVIVIGATNRIDAIDPALRRPGRFDRELFFSLPGKKEREEILKVHVSQWNKPPSKQLLSYLSETAIGYCGSDLRALCAEAVIQSFRRVYPQVYNSDFKLMLNPENVVVEKVDFLRAKSLIVPASHRTTQGLGRKLLPILEALFSDILSNIYSVLEQSFPHGLNLTLSKVKLSANLKPAQLLIIGDSPEYGQTLHLAPAILYKMEHINTYLLDLSILYKESGRSSEESIIQVFNEARRNVPSVIYIPSIDNWWLLVNETVKALLLSQLSQLAPNIPLLFLATADSPYDELSDEVKNIFSTYRNEVFQIHLPTEERRKEFFKPLFNDVCWKAPRPKRERPKTPPLLPKAPTPPPTPLTEDQLRKLYDQEEHTLRELRIFLRDICKKLANNKLFYMFTKPVDTEEVPDYPTIIKEPMDLETMMTKVDFHKYECARHFLDDIELICRNALEYNPAKTSADKQIRHRACSLRDYAYTLIKNEMDSDFEDKCQDIAKKRLVRKVSVAKYLPAYIHTPEESIILKETNEETENVENADVDKIEIKTEENASKLNSMKRKKLSSCKRSYGCIKKRRKLDRSNNLDMPEDQAEDYKDLSEESKDNEGILGLSTGDPETSNTSVNTTLPLTINCDQETNMKSFAQRRLSDLMSPSELLDNHLEFDDVDQALNENVGNEMNSNEVQCSKSELDEVLEHVVKITTQCSLQDLLDLYNQLSRIIKKYSNTFDRTNLPNELLEELNRFERQQKIAEVVVADGVEICYG